jgi:FAD synthase
MKMEFVERLRPERRFENLDELVAQIRSDAEQAAELLAREPTVESA